MCEKGGFKIWRKIYAIVIASLLIICVLVDFFYYDVISESTDPVWQPEKEISRDLGTESQYNPTIAVENGKVHAAWLDYSNQVNGAISYRRYNGNSWGSISEIAKDVAHPSYKSKPHIAVENDYIYLVWDDNSDGDRDIYYIYYDRTSWQTAEEISIECGTSDQRDPAIYVENEVVHVVWINGTNYNGTDDLFYRKFINGKWQSPVRLGYGCGSLSIAVENDEVFVVSGSGNPNDYDIYYWYFNGSSWQSPIVLSTDAVNQYQQSPDITVENGKVHVVWTDGTTGPTDTSGIFYRYFNGITWEDEVLLSENAYEEFKFSPAIAVENSQVYVVWAEPGPNGDRDVYFRHNNGTGWEPIEQISTNLTTNHQTNPAICIENGDIHVVWQQRIDDDSYLDYDIYYKKFGILEEDKPKENDNPISFILAILTLFILVGILMAIIILRKRRRA